MKFLIALSFIVLSVVPSCNDDDALLAPSVCGAEIAFVSSITDRVSGDGFSISSTSVEGPCLTITVSGTGCNPEEWTAALVTDGSVAESAPTQTTARFVFDNQLEEASITCQTLTLKDFTFDISSYLTSSVVPSNLTLLGSDSASTAVLVE